MMSVEPDVRPTLVARRLCRFLQDRGELALDATEGPIEDDPRGEFEISVEGDRLASVTTLIREFCLTNGMQVIHAIPDGQAGSRFVLAWRKGTDAPRFLSPRVRSRSHAAQPETHHRGVWVAFLGPDGSGKTTVIRSIERRLAPAFASTKLYHLRPTVGGDPTPTGDGPPPTRAEPRGFFGSIAKLAYWWVDYNVGYAFDIRRRLARTTLVLFDRYYPDLFVDPVRYRHGAPAWFASLVGRTIPEPAAYVVLDVPETTLRQRKDELTLDEAGEQRRAYRRLASQNDRFHVIDASGPVEVSVAAAEQVVLDLLERRARR